MSLLQQNLHSYCCTLRCFVVLLSIMLTTSAFAEPLTSNDQLAEMLRTSAKAQHVSLYKIGDSVEGRPLWAIKLISGSPNEDACIALLIGHQHGDEPAGAEALIDLIQRLASDIDSVPAGLELWVVPRANPDGARIGKRRNANDFDLNRDHLLLSQPETRALHRLTRQIQPHVIVDCHEFNRDSADYKERGWSEWPLIMMDTANVMAMPEGLYDQGVQLCQRPKAVMDKAGINYQRYVVGNCPDPHDNGEMRHSTLSPDDARNGLSLYGASSLIIESGISRQSEHPHANIGDRINGYKLLFDQLLGDPSQLDLLRDLTKSVRSEPAPKLIPTHSIWCNHRPRLTKVPVIDRATGKVLQIDTPTMMHCRTVKSAVHAPVGYLIKEDAASVFSDLLDAHGLAFTVVDTPTEFRVQTVALERVEDEFDPVYKQYAGRQITRPLGIATHEFSAGSLYVALDELSAIDARRAMLVLEPRQLYGLYQWPAFHNLVHSDGTLPVARLLPATPSTHPGPIHQEP